MAESVTEEMVTFSDPVAFSLYATPVMWPWLFSRIVVAVPSTISALLEVEGRRGRGGKRRKGKEREGEGNKRVEKLAH